MSVQFDRAARLLTARPDGETVRGVADRTRSGRVVEDGVPRWLRVLALPDSRAHGPIWDGPIAAPTLAGLRRPELLTWGTWRPRDDAGQVVRAELWELVDEPVCSSHEQLTPAQARALHLGPGWWRSLDESLNRLAAYDTTRVPRTQQQITAAMRNAYGPDVPSTVRRWVTQHGDLRWTNVTAGTPYLLDWEHWGLAPAGADAATLYCTSLLAAEMAADVHRRYRHVLDSPDGRIAQLCVCVQLRRHADIGALAEPLDRLAHSLLAR
ncbi:hypothetical protein AGRA3207_002504 [Actinomadura graeca]|uniref:Aminoglycoside phosphotransferase n=1 Tax=Actinomadura graeca TaxID=2750812 RepID=A0ABX8QSE7_9ACTN|nr:hypothetical protein [Actinomadura graeca]QXJ21631.1 hypothetical protein AGRA3207_002504 [Actinomadura graeca]